MITVYTSHAAATQAPWQAPDARFIYHLELTEFGLKSTPRYDSVTAVVVIARNSRAARNLAASVSENEGPGVWRDPCMASIRKIGLARRPNQQPARERVVCVEGLTG